MSNPWQSRSEAGAGVLLRIYVWLSLRVGRSVARCMLFPICAYFLIVRGPERAASRQYLARVLDRPPTYADVVRHFWTFSQVVLDRLFLVTQPEAFSMQVEGVDALDAALDAGGGCVMLGSHLGSFEASRFYCRYKPHVPVHILMDRHVNARISEVFEALDPNLAAQIIDPRGGVTDLAFKVANAISNNGVVAVLADRYVGDEATVSVTLCGETAQLPRGPFELAMVTKAPILVFFGLFLQGNSYEVIFEEITLNERPRRSEREAAIAGLAQSFATKLEQHAKRAPYNWFNFYPFWDRDRADER